MTSTFTFTARGHPNVRATHLTTLEITKDHELTPRGDCIAAVAALFDETALQKFLTGAKRLTLVLACKGQEERVSGDYNPAFIAGQEIVLRRGTFASPRTLLLNADRACVDLDRSFVETIKNDAVVITIDIIKTH